MYFLATVSIQLINYIAWQRNYTFIIKLLITNLKYLLDVAILKPSPLFKMVNKCNKAVFWSSVLWNLKIWCSTASSTRWRLCKVVYLSVSFRNKSSMFDGELVDVFLQRERHPPQNQDEDLSSEVKSLFTDPLFDSHLTKIKLSLESFAWGRWDLHQHLSPFSFSI